MPLFASSSPFDGDVEKATSELNTTEDWAVIMDICDKVKTTNGSKDCLRSIVKRLNHRVPFVSMQALTLLNACINNCGREFHLEVSSRDFVSECRTLIGQKAHPRVAQKLKFLIRTWAEMKEFKDDPSLSLIPGLFESLRKEGTDFADPDSAPTKTASTPSKDPNVVQSQQEEDDIAKAIALSLQENERGASQKTTSLYPTSFSTMTQGSTISSSRPREVRKVRALYDFEAAEDNELTFKAGELISVLDDSDPNWWKGFNQRGEGLFPANFATSDLTVEPEEPKKVQFNEEVQVKTIEAPEEVEIDESKIDDMLQQIQNADPTGEVNPDSVEMLQLEEQCKAMGPLIDAELEKIDKKHASLCEINTKVLEALQMYHNLMKETPAPYAFKSMSYSTPLPQGQAGAMYNGSQPQFAPQGPQMGQGQIPQPQGQLSQAPQGQISQVPQGQISHIPQGQMSQVPQGQLSQVQGQMSRLPQGQMSQIPQGQGQISQGSQGQMLGQQQQPQNFSSVSSQDFNNSSIVSSLASGTSTYQTPSVGQTHPPQNIIPQQQVVPQYIPQADYGANMATMYQPQMTQQQLL